MKYIFPKYFLDFFEHEALKSFDNIDQIETLALVIGKEERNSIQICELIFPSQEGKSDFVEDQGRFKIVMIFSFSFLSY